MSNSHLPFSSTSPVDSVPYKAPNYSTKVISELKSEIMSLELKFKEIQNPQPLKIPDRATIEIDFYEYLKKIEKEKGAKACPDGESNLWKELQFLLANDPSRASEHWVTFHRISEYRSQQEPFVRSPELQIAEIETKLTALLQTWQDYTGTEYPL